LERTFIRDCIDKAIAGLEVDEAARPTVDQDTAGVLGSPVIADTIFEKIRDAKVVVADVTLTGHTPAGKRLANSNVAIELGYTLGVHGYKVLVKVMNTHYGPPQELPFDLVHRRFPVRFNLPPDASSEERGQVRDALVRELRGILQLYVDANRPPPELFAPTRSTYNAATYWQPGEQLATDGATGRPVTYSQADPLLYLRTWPREKIPPLSFALLNDHSKSSIQPLAGRPSGWSPARNKYGTVAYSPSVDDGRSTTQVLKSGEIWGVNSWFLRPRQGFPKFVPADGCEAGLQESLSRYLSAGRDHFGYSQIVQVESGLVNVKDFKLAIDVRDAPGGMVGPIHDDVTISTFVDLNEPETTQAALLKIFAGIFEAAGLERPKNYRNFPAKR
jgi:hypothetical protein